MNCEPILESSNSLSNHMLLLQLDGAKNEVCENLVAYVTWMSFKTPEIEGGNGLCSYKPKTIF